MKAKKVMALMLCAAMVTSMSATAAFAAEEKEDAATEESADSTAAEDPTAQFDGLKANEAYVFPMMVKSFQSTYWDAAQEGMKKASKELGVDYKPQGPNSESDIADQVNMINTAIASNPVGLGLAACDTSSVTDALKTCAEKGIPVVTFDTGIADAPEGSVVCEVCTDNAQAGAVAAENMYNSIKDVVKDAEGQVVIGEVNQDATAQNIQQRGTGFINKMIELLQADGKTVAVSGNEFYVNAAEGADADAKDADVVIQVAVPAQTTVELCSTEAQAILSQENCIAVFGSNQVSAEGVLAANANLNVLGSDPANGDVVGVGFDAGSIIKAAVKDGTFIGAVTQSPLMMGYYAIYALTAAANGQELEDVPTDGYWYDATNMEDEDIAPNLYD
ncbi:MULTISPECIES: substrate-binding domain-containing protein [Blautia]|jgi:ribose transport system substrate-binding protein|uniref:substrate-binding domain-containing protein n=1 Tax=Blautia TaxID=572511 RepID=UPI0015711BEA|nr:MULTISPECIES: substrate-binding domain-containing protein [Blautia]MCC2726012.1 substrate-binding domain-containing protein [Blautia sp. MSK22_86]NSF56905.1 substrate-binding domain-containing protein [Blautia massiliensis (ex Durand et al. 2017)]NSK72250.1 substrate-binding domain-containing protein [Blautia massiliensis (ex Durand et al. 2017)]